MLDKTRSKEAAAKRKAGAQPGNKFAVGSPGNTIKVHDPIILAQQFHDFIDTEDDPQIAKFCLPREMPSREHLWLLAKSCDDLSNAITRAKAKCEIYLTSSKCTLHPKVIGIRLSANHGLSETQKVDQNLSGGLEVKLTGDLADWAK